MAIKRMSSFPTIHTHTVLMAIFPGEPGLASCNSPSPFILELRILLGQA